MIDAHVLAADYLLPALIVFAGLVAYAFFIRPTLKQTPALRDLYASEENILIALSHKFAGLKQKLATIVLATGTFVVATYDSLTPLLAEAGIQITPAQYLPSVPNWVWPITALAGLWLLSYFRKLADRQARLNAEALLNAGHTLAAPAPGLPVSTLPSPLPVKTS